MSPRNQQFSPQSVLEEALALVRSEGIQALSARTLGSRLGSSVAPVYAAFPSMEALRVALLDQAAGCLSVTIAAQKSGKPFLDMGVGIAIFARDHKNLYEALLNSGGSLGRLGVFKQELQDRLDQDSGFKDLVGDRMGPIFERMWLFTLGTASALLHGFMKDTSDQGLQDLMTTQGTLVIIGEVLSRGRLSEKSIRDSWTALNAARL